jgi:hypothetical protein
MWHKLERSQIASLVAAEFLLAYISNVFHNLAQMFRWHVSLLCFDKASLAFLTKPVALCAKPFFFLLGEFGYLRINRRAIAGRWRSHARRRRYGARTPPRRRRRWRKGGHLGRSRDYSERWMNVLLMFPSVYTISVHQ